VTVPTVRVLVVDDSAVIRRLLTDVIDADPDLEVVGTAPNGEIAVEKIARLQPDVVTLDVEMPVMDGLATLRELRARGLMKPTIMFSTLTERGAAATLDAMALGAADYVTKPSNTGGFDEARQRVRDELLPKLRALGAPVTAALRHRQRMLPPRRGARCDLVAIGCSTGGPNALAELFQHLPDDLRVPLVVTQHMPPVFTGLLARRLDALSDLEVLEAEDGMELRPGRAVIAPGDHHLLLAPRGPDVVATLDQGPPESSCRPAVDPMFRSVARLFGARALGVVLTGMGHDGLVGARWLKEAGAQVIVQDAETSVVWGMPGSIADEELADAVLPLPELAPAILRWVGPSRPAPAATRGAAR
jgi:two-component system, chemotaxis family, protein-glutamate methylesterase/glutaminase